MSAQSYHENYATHDNTDQYQNKAYNGEGFDFLPYVVKHECSTFLLFKSIQRKPNSIIPNLKKLSITNIIMIMTHDGGINRIQMKEGGNNRLGENQSITGTGRNYANRACTAAPCYALQCERLGAGDFRALDAAANRIGGDLFRLNGLLAGDRAHRQHRFGGPHPERRGVGKSPDLMPPGEEQGTKRMLMVCFSIS